MAWNRRYTLWNTLGLYVSVYGHKRFVCSDLTQYSMIITYIFETHTNLLMRNKLSDFLFRWMIPHWKLAICFNNNDVKRSVFHEKRHFILIFLNWVWMKHKNILILSHNGHFLVWNCSGKSRHIKFIWIGLMINFYYYNSYYNYSY